MPCGQKDMRRCRPWRAPGTCAARGKTGMSSTHACRIGIGAGVGRAFAGPAMLSLFLVGGCSTSDRAPGLGNPSGGDLPVGSVNPSQDPTCLEEGAAKECGQVDHTNGNYVT